MATGDVTGAKRPRYQANERFDSGDADAASRAPQEFNDALQRALVTTPRATAGAVMPGMIITGLSLTLNPTSGADGKVRINTELGIAVDANGRYIIKPNGVTVDVNIPAGSYQLYLFHQETPGDNATRRFLTVIAPFTEYPDAMNTTFQSSYGAYVRAGNNTNTVADAVVDGATTPLVCLGIVTNTAGVITCTGYNATTAPNGSDITNRMSMVKAPTTPPVVNTRNGSPQTLHDVITAALFYLGKAVWKGSAALTPTAANNFGAFTEATQGLQKTQEDLDIAEAAIATLDAKLEAYGARVRNVPILASPGVDLTYNTTIGADGCSYVSISAAWLWHSLDHGAWSVRAGEQLTDVTFRFNTPGGAGTFATARLCRWNTSGVSADLENWAVTSGAAGWGLHVHTLATPITLGTSVRYFLRLEGTASGDMLGACYVVVDAFP